MKSCLLSATPLAVPAHGGSRASTLGSLSARFAAASSSCVSPRLSAASSQPHRAAPALRSACGLELSSTASSFCNAAPAALLLPRACSTAALSSRARRLAAHAAKKKDEPPSIYKDTVTLPQTDFSLRANSVVREPELQKWWEEENIYAAAKEAAPEGSEYTLHDGPPYANGDLHIGHALNKILKDFINRYQILQGRQVTYVPGWDCHGLPIELKVLQSMDQEARKSLTPIKLRKKARNFALKTVDKQREQFRRYGIWGEWEDPYMTLLPEYEAAQIGVFGQMFLNGHIYRGLKPVHWSPSSQTALAEAELEYPEGHTSRSIYVGMELTSVGQNFPEELAGLQGSLSLGIWTTTPWTIPANAAVAINDRLEYCIVKRRAAEAAAAEGDEGKAESKAPLPWPTEHLVIAKGLVDTLAAKFGASLEVVADVPGAALEGCSYRHPLYDRESPVVVGGDYITTESGTGLVHTAPGHGQEDYLVGMRMGLPLLSPVDDRGFFTEEAGERFAGLNVQGDGNSAVIEALQACNALILEEKYQHKYPYDWRTKKPTIFRATEQWFASVEGFRDEALEAISKVEWIPAAGEKRITSMTAGRSDWCISRQRTWGVPIPAFYYIDTNEVLMDEAIINHVQEIVRTKGTDAWFELELEELLPEQYKAEAPKLKRGTDTMDVWFDSGSSWASVVEQRHGLKLPAQLYLEGSDQHRGWFQSSLLTSVATRGQAPYEKVLTHGFVLDEKGMKMSKSLGNVLDPKRVIEGGKNQKQEPPYGADVLRMWVASVDYSNDVLIGGGILKQISEMYRKMRGTLRYLLGSISDFDPSQDAVSYQELPSLDRYLLQRLDGVVREAREGYEAFSFVRVYQLLNRFTINDLSTFYLDTAKDRLYIREADDHARRSCQTVIYHILKAYLAVMAPIAPHVSEDAWQSLSSTVQGLPKSVFLAGWPELPEEWSSMDARELSYWDKLLALRSDVNKTMEQARTDKVIRASLEAQVVLHFSEVSEEGQEVVEQLTQLSSAQEKNAVDDLRYIFIVSGVSVTDDAAELSAKCGKYTMETELEGVGKVTIGVMPADGSKCERCWMYSEHLGSDSAHPTLCERCTPIVVDLFAKRAQQQPASEPEPAAL